MKIIGVIPARFASTRFPGKPLALIAGKSLVQHVVEQCLKAKTLQEVIVATDDSRIADIAKRFCRVEMTSPNHSSGTDRIAEVIQRIDADAAINIQGDEPLIGPGVIDAVAHKLNEPSSSPPESIQRFNDSTIQRFNAVAAPMSTAATRITDAAEYDNPNVVKVVVNSAGRALYFSRRTIPYVRDAASASVREQLAAFPFLKHLGIYGYRRETLLRLVKFPISALEQAEKLEQLRALENGIQIAVATVHYESIGVDTPEDVARVERILQTKR